jgi:hypothetical protein
MGKSGRLASLGGWAVNPSSGRSKRVMFLFVLPLMPCRLLGATPTLAQSSQLHLPPYCLDKSKMIPEGMRKLKREL